MFAMPDGFLPFSIDKIIIKRKMAIIDDVYSIKMPLINPRIIPISKVEFRNAVCVLKRFSSLDYLRETKEFERKITK